MDRAVMSTEARQTPERTAKCEAAKKKHKEFFDRVSTEVRAILVLPCRSYNFIGPFIRQIKLNKTYYILIAGQIAHFESSSCFRFASSQRNCL
ncbi:unnamed protein product [Toxocara canis]|uniref:FLYWCH-type domain-containing protein n=1 Tax=Toxocara canis TaxID=6265 RepID=A0A183U8V0_TOXCA|nr:unnamed protein product [Toxocara canis]